MAKVKPNFGEAKVQTETFDDSSSIGSNNGILIKKSANNFDLNKLKNKKAAPRPTSELGATYSIVTIVYLPR